MTDTVALKYKRVDREHYTGELFFCSPGEGHPELFLDSFERVTFRWMMQRFSERLNIYSEAAASMQRTDRAGLPANTLDDQTTALLRQDPEAVVRAMTIVVHVPISTKPPAPLPPVLVAGSGAIADSFGERVCCRRRVLVKGRAASAPAERQIECPCCGLWVNTILDERSVPQPNPTGVGKISARIDYLAFCCPSGTSLTATPIDERWASVSVEELLKYNVPKFFLPRAWNEGRNWITHEALDLKYRLYKQEKMSS